MHQNHATMHNDILRIKKFFMLLVLGQGQKQKGRRQLCTAQTILFSIVNREILPVA